MKIGFDAKRALNNSTGLGNHARILLNALMKLYPEHEYLLFSPKASEEFLNQLDGNPPIIFPRSKWSRAFHPLWRSFGIVEPLKQSGVNVYHGLSNEIPFTIHRSKIRTVVTIHDLIFMKHREQYPFTDRKIYELKTRYAAKYADKIIAVSQETKADLVNYFGIAQEKIEVIYQSVDPAYYQTAGEQTKQFVREKYNLPGKFILNVSSFFPRKNQKIIVEAFDIIKEKVEENLLLVGSVGNEYEKVNSLIQQKKLQQRVKIISGISSEELPALYQMASVFIYPSLYEGFGAPVLEALASRIPVITTARGCMEEAGGKDSVYIEPNDAGRLAEAFLRVLGNQSLRYQMIETGYKHALRLTPEIFAQETMQLYQRIR